MKKWYIAASLICLGITSKASVNYWIGNEASNWLNADNWSNGIPSVNDTVFFDGVTTIVTVDVNPNIAGLQIINGSNVVFSSNATTLVTIGNLNVSGPVVFRIGTGSSFTIEGKVAGRGVSIQTYGNFTATNAVVDGEFIFGAFACTWNVNAFPSSFCTTNISGTVTVTATNTGSVMSGGISNGNPGTVSFLNGATLNWQRSGGSAPNANFANGSVINVTGIAGSNMNFNSGARYNGLLTWNCPLQTISGSSAILVPGSNLLMDSVRIINTGTGSVRLATNPNQYTINSLEVNGGTLELAAPNTDPLGRVDTIANQLKITGGTVYGNATFNFDNLGAAYPHTMVLKGNFIMTGGTLDFSNRTAGNAPGGSFHLMVQGDVLQTGGTIRATKGFDGLNRLTLNGSAQQNLSLSNIRDTISLAVDNAAGVSLQRALSLPYMLQLQSGYLQLNAYDLSVAAERIVQFAVDPTPSVVTNGMGMLLITGVVTPQRFPVAPFPGGYNPVSISSNSLPVNYAVGVAYGLRSVASLNTLKAVNRTWHIVSSLAVPGGTTRVSFQYADSERVVGSTLDAAADMYLAHLGSEWSYDPYAAVTPTGGPVSYVAGLYAPAKIDSFFSIGNAGLLTNTYIFNGTGNWDEPSNWVNNAVPPQPLPAGKEIIIDPVSGDCILNRTQNISPGARLRVSSNKNFVVPGTLIVQ